VIAQTVMLVDWDHVTIIGSSCGKTTSSLMFELQNVASNYYAKEEQPPPVPIHTPPPLSSHSRQQFRQRRPALPVRIPPRRNRNLHIQ
jgi:hypothetical protein